MPRFSISHSTNTDELYSDRQLHESILKNEHYTEMGQQIKAIRNERGLTVEKAAERLGVSTTSIKLFEKGKSLRFDNILRICRGYECTIAEIIPYEFLEYTSPLTTLIPIIGKRQIAAMKAGLDKIERSYLVER